MDAHMYWKIRDGKILTKRLEINVTHHCNMSCRGCSHLSPNLPKFFELPESISRDLFVLSKNFRTECISLLGGEPLLHPDLLEIIDVIRKSGITDRIRVITNGLLLHKMSDQFWQKVDEVHVSLYPSHPMRVEDLKVFQNNSKNHSSYLELRYQDYFSEFFSDLGTSNDDLIKKIYLTCNAPREGCCHTLYHGQYYKCPKAVFIPFVYQDRFDFSRGEDSVKIKEDILFVQELAAYLSSDQPLQTCRYCLGSVGKRFIPKQVPRRPTSRMTTSEELIDWKRLEKLTGNRGFPVPVWLRKKTWSQINIMMALLPSSVRLSPKLRRFISRITDISRRHIR
jgi:GTP 3',8-cyclase